MRTLMLIDLSVHQTHSQERLSKSKDRKLGKQLAVLYKVKKDITH